VDEPGVDLPAAIAVMSSYADVPVRPGLCCFGEVGLSGEVRMVARMEDRVKEALRVGFTQVLVPAGFLRKYKGGSNVIGVSTAEEAVRNALSR
jgi:DNA repair protein RadA/Sms